MPKVLNTHTAPLDIAGSVVAPGDSKEVAKEALDVWAKGAAAAKWLETGLVAVEKPKRTTKPKAAKE